MRVQLASILLNEEEWLRKHYEQHKNWPGLVNWTFVEGADSQFAIANPSLVTPEGLSVDQTSEILREIARSDSRVILIQHGWMSRPDKLQSKCEGRNRYIDVSERVKPDIIVATDLDEFYTKQDQQRINDIVQKGWESPYTAWMFKQRHIWSPPFYKRPDVWVEEFTEEVIGGYWQIPHTRVWRYTPGMVHRRNHNWPEHNGKYLTSSMMRCDLMDQTGMPQCVHLGYASSAVNRTAKASYYKARGEGQEGGRIGRRRQMYLACRDAHLSWKPGDVLPGGAEVISYTGPKPECFG